MKIYSNKNSPSGFSLLEILLVVALIALLAVVLVPRVSSVFRVGVQSSARRLASMVKYTYDQSVLSGKPHRILIDIDAQTWKVQISKDGKLPHKEAAEEFLPPGMSSYDLKESREQIEEATNDGYAAIKGEVNVNLPKGVQIIAVESWRLDEKENPARKGQVSIYSFPNGYIDEAVIYLAEMGKENLQQFKVTIKSLTGRVFIETIEPGLQR